MSFKRRKWECRSCGLSASRLALILILIIVANLAAPPAANALTRVDALTLEPGEEPVTSAVIDIANGYAYLGVGYSGAPFGARVVKVKLSDFSRVGALTIETGAVRFLSAVIDATNGFAYFGTITDPGRVVKVDIKTPLPTLVGVLTLEPGEEMLTSAVIDTAGGFAYFGTTTYRGRVVKVDIKTPLPTRVGALTLEPYSPLNSAVIDTTNGFAYFGTYTKVVKVGIRVDQIAPTTTVSLSGILGINGWYVSNVQVTLDAIDNPGGSGVKRTEYSFDGMNWITYTFPFMVSTEETTTLHYRSIDNVGNVEPTKTQAIKIDKIAPTLSKNLTGTQGNTPWWVSDVTVTLTAGDAVSGVAKVEYSFDGSIWKIYTAPFTVSEGTTTLHHRATDNAGNVDVLAPQMIQVDKTPPTIMITAPTDGAYYVLGQPVAASYSASDGLSGLGTIGGTVPSGNNIDTSTVGLKNFTVTATDKAGNTATRTITYKVIYGFSGFLPPLKEKDTVKAGSTIPVKFQLTDYGGNYISTAIARLWVDSLSNPGESSGESGTGNYFRYDTANNQYIFNLSTKNLATGQHTIYATLNDGAVYAISVTLR